MKKFLSLVSVLVLWPLCAWTQQSENGIKQEGSGSFNIGYAHLNNSDFQKFLPEGFYQLSESYLLLGGEGYGLKGNFLVGGSGQAIVGQDESNGSLKTEISGGMGFFNLGYTLVNQDKIKVFPMLGIGGGSMELRISEHKDVSVNEIIQEPSREITLEVGNFLLDFSLGLDYIPRIHMAKNGKEGGGFKTGVRVGYMLGFNSDNWNYGGGDVNGAPNFGLNSFYVKMVIGGYGFTIEER